MFIQTLVINTEKCLFSVFLLEHQRVVTGLKFGAFTCFDDVGQLVEQEFVVSSSVQALLHVAVELVHHALHVCVLVLLDTRHRHLQFQRFP